MRARTSHQTFGRVGKRDPSWSESDWASAGPSEVVPLASEGGGEGRGMLRGCLSRLDACASPEVWKGVSGGVTAGLTNGGAGTVPA